jgi:hypothetical protein
MTVGEYIHFMSGAAGVNLEAQARIPSPPNQVWLQLN